MSDVSKLNFGDNGGDRNVKDAVAREKLTVIDPTAGQGLITFGVDANGNYGYKKVGADTVTPFKTGGGGFTGCDITSHTGSTQRSITTTSGLRYYFDSDVEAGEYLLVFCIGNTNMDGLIRLRNFDSYAVYANESERYVSRNERDLGLVMGKLIVTDLIPANTYLEVLHLNSGSYSRISPYILLLAKI